MTGVHFWNVGLLHRGACSDEMHGKCKWHDEHLSAMMVADLDSAIAAAATTASTGWIACWCCRTIQQAGQH